MKENPRFSWSLVLMLFLIVVAFVYTSPIEGLYYGWPDIEAYWTAVWWDKWFFLLGALTIFFATKIGRLRHWSVGLLVGYSMLSALWALGWSGAYEHQPEFIRAAIQIYSAYAYIAIAMLASVLLWFRLSDFMMAEMAIELLCILNSAAIILQTSFEVSPGLRGGFLGNPSMGGCFVAMTAPLVYRAAFPLRRSTGIPRVAVLLPIAAVLFTGTSQPVGVLAVVAVMYYMCVKLARPLYIVPNPDFGAIHWDEARQLWVGTGIGRYIGQEVVTSPDRIVWTRTRSERRPIDRRRLASVAAAAAVGIAIAGITIPLTSSKQGRSPFDSSGRFQVWREVIPAWAEVGRTWVGQGTGTTPAIVPRIQALFGSIKSGGGTNMFSFEEYRWLHSDWLQILVENGAIGLILALLTAWFAARRAWIEGPAFFAAVMGYIATMTFNFPVHQPFHALVGAILLARVFYKQSYCGGENA